MTAFGLHGSLLATAVITVILLLTLVDSSALGIEQKRTSGVQKRPTEILICAVSKRQEKNDMVKQLAGVCSVGASFLHRFSQSEGSSWKEIKLQVVSLNLCHGCSPLLTLHP
jgi:hypothetical protein